MSEIKSDFKEEAVVFCKTEYGSERNCNGSKYEDFTIKTEPEEQNGFASSGEESENGIIVEEKDPLALENDTNFDLVKCAICGDKVTGKHYGAMSCDGCKGFFRRSVRRQTIYVCRSERNCKMDLSKRNQCRYCRLKSCFRAGMRANSVQSTRDKIGPVKNKDESDSSRVLLATLVSAELATRFWLGGAVETNSHFDISTKKVASVEAILNSFVQQLHRLVKWTSCIPVVHELPIDDKILLLRSHSAELIILNLARRSMHLTDTLLLGNDTILLKDSEGRNIIYDLDVCRISERIMDEIVSPLSSLQIDNTEFSLLKAIIFFDPSISGLSDPDKIKQYGNEVQSHLENYVSDRLYHCSGRLSKLLLLIRPLQSISWQMIEQIHFAKLYGFAQIDSLIDEMLLDGRHLEYSEENSLNPDSTENSKAVDTTENPKNLDSAENPRSLIDVTNIPDLIEEVKPRLVAVSKTKPKDMIITIYNCGQRHFGENYIQELYDKSNDAEILEKCKDIKWHFIGHLQRNKVNKLVSVPCLFAVETVESEKLATALNNAWEKLKKTEPLNVMVQVNTSSEEEKGGVDPEKCYFLVDYILKNCPNLCLIGLMTIGKYGYDLTLGPNPDFLILKKCREDVCNKMNWPLNRLELSMGMSTDYEHAIDLGSTSVRVGSSIFGYREKKTDTKKICEGLENIKVL